MYRINASVVAILMLVSMSAAGQSYQQRLPTGGFDRHFFGVNRWDTVAEGLFVDDGRYLEAEPDSFFADILLEFESLGLASIPGAQDIVRARIAVDPTGSWVEQVIFILYERTGSTIEFREQILAECTSQTGGTRTYVGAFDRSLVVGNLGVLVSIFKHDLDTPVRLEAVDILAID